LLYQNIINGYIPPYQYGALNDFIAKWGKEKYDDYQFYNVWHKDDDENNIDGIHKRRRHIGLNTYEQQRRNKYIFKERLKSKTAKSEIILE